jgi:hypothetical protein
MKSHIHQFSNICKLHIITQDNYSSNEKKLSDVNGMHTSQPSGSLCKPMLVRTGVAAATNILSICPRILPAHNVNGKLINIHASCILGNCQKHKELKRSI